MNFEWKQGNDVELLINGDQFFPKVFETIRAARQEILLETFIIFNDEVGKGLKEALLEAAARQVRIDVTVDGYGTADLDSNYIDELAAAGIRMHVYDPKPRRFGMRTNLFRRLHRKVVVVDGEVAYIGGINFGADHLPKKDPMAKQDYAVRVTGPIVEDIRSAAKALLLEHHAAQELPDITAKVSPSGEVGMLMAVRDNDDHRNDIEEQYIMAIRSANYRVFIANAYFFPGYRLWHELRSAASRGVEVTLVLQGKPDMPWARMFSKTLYDYFVRDGIHIFEYRERPLHGKIAIIDNQWSTVGSSNLDPLSLSLNLEANLFIHDTRLNQEIYEHLAGLIDKSCRRVTPKLAGRGRWWRVPLMVVSFHFLRHFPVTMGWHPAHVSKIKPLTAEQARKRRLLRKNRSR